MHGAAKISGKVLAGGEERARSHTAFSVFLCGGAKRVWFSYCYTKNDQILAIVDWQLPDWC